MEKRIVTVLNLLKRETAKLPLPWVTELAKQEKKPYLVLIAALLSVRTKDNTTKRASQRLFTRATTPQEMLELGYRTIAQLIYPVGFYHQKAENILRISQRLCNMYKGRIPRQRDVLMSFPGVGRKVANLVLGLSFGLPAICVDTHVHRISNRLGIINTKDVYSSERELEKVIPRHLWVELNTIMVSFGQHVCLPRRPLCSQCCLSRVCLKKGVENFH